MYKVWFGEIKPVEVERETESSVWINGNRSSKKSSYSIFFETFEEAKKYVIESIQKQIDSLENKLHARKLDLEKATRLQAGK